MRPVHINKWVLEPRDRHQLYVMQCFLLREEGLLETTSLLRRGGGKVCVHLFYLPQTPLCGISLGMLLL